VAGEVVKAAFSRRTADKPTCHPQKSLPKNLNIFALLFITIARSWQFLIVWKNGGKKQFSV